MLLKQIRLKNFRNFHNETVNFNPFLTIIIGANSKGKTNLLESVYFVINGVGFREKREEELINFGHNDASVEGIFNLGDTVMDYQVTLDKNSEIVKKTFYINRTKKKTVDYLQNQTRAVLFSPEQINTITGTPSLRRSYFNLLISYYDYEYKKRLVNYETALRKRNRVLEFSQNEEKLKEELKFWDKYLEEQAAYVTQKREEYLNYLNQNQKIDDKQFEIVYEKNIFDKEHLEKVFDQEKRWRQTLIGPQKDDFKIYLKKDNLNENIHLYGSRSEQRLAILWLKVNEVKYYEAFFKKKPIILLDDIFSEFDLENKKLIFEVVEKYQTIVTTTEQELLDLSDMPKSVIKL